MSDIRIKKLESLLQKELSMLIVSGRIKDPRLHGLVSVTRVQMSADGAYAKAFISCLEGDDELASSVGALNHASGFMQAALAKRIRLRQTPKLSFFPDPGPIKGFEINKKIEGLGS